MVLLVTGALLPSLAFADLSAQADVSFWWDIVEQDENGARQLGTDDLAAQETSGFRLNRARITLFPSLPEYHLYGKAQAEFADTPMLLDCWISWKPISLFNIYVGQMKIPSTYEVGIDEYHLDFITRGNFSKNVTSWSLADTPFDSTIKGLNTRQRDMGFGFKGAWQAGQSWDVFKYFLMVSNGIGADQGIGGKEGQGLFTGNNFGDYFYGARAEVSPLEWLTLGGYYSINNHDHLLYRDGKSVIDLGRTSWDVDAQAKLPWGFRAAALYGDGHIRDYWGGYNGRDRYRYLGWEAKIIKGFWNDKLELGVRFDRYRDDLNYSPYPTTQDNWTYGINWNPLPQFRLQLDYITKDTIQENHTDLADNIIFMQIEMLLDSPLLIKQ